MAAYQPTPKPITNIETGLARCYRNNALSQIGRQDLARGKARTRKLSKGVSAAPLAPMQYISVLLRAFPASELMSSFARMADVRHRSPYVRNWRDTCQMLCGLFMATLASERMKLLSLNPDTLCLSKRPCHRRSSADQVRSSGVQSPCLWAS